MKRLIAIASLALFGCAQSTPSTLDASVAPLMAAHADVPGNGVLWTAGGTNQTTPASCSVGSGLLQLDGGVPYCVPLASTEMLFGGIDGSVAQDPGVTYVTGTPGTLVVSALLETGVSVQHSLTGLDGGVNTVTLTAAEYQNGAVRFNGAPGSSPTGILIQLPAIAGGASGYSMDIDMTAVNMTNVGLLGFTVGANPSRTVVPQAGVYRVITNGTSAPTVAFMRPPSVGEVQSGTVGLDAGVGTVSTGITLTSSSRVFITVNTLSGFPNSTQFIVPNSSIATGGPGTASFTVTGVSIGGATVTTDGALLNYLIVN